MAEKTHIDLGENIFKMVADHVNGYYKMNCVSII